MANPMSPTVTTPRAPVARGRRSAGQPACLGAGARWFASRGFSVRPNVSVPNSGCVKASVIGMMISIVVILPYLTALVLTGSVVALTWSG